MQRYKVTIEYDGSNYHGWQSQPELPTIQGEIETALEKLCQEKTEIFAAGRTDAGVHALGQVVHFDIAKRFSSHTILRGLNSYLRHSNVVVREVEPVSSDFHARFMAIRRQYLYRILNRQTPSALYKNHVWHIHYPLALDAMESAANLLIGKHDFSSFRHPGCYAASPVKTLEKIAISKNEEEIHLRFSAPSFLYHMVRNLVGTLVYVGREKYPPEYIDTILQAKSRSAAGPTAPAHGLYFQAVEYKNA